MAEDRSVHWIALESNPELMTRFLHDLGVSEEWTVVDVLGFDQELLDMVPKPVAAVILLFPPGAKPPRDVLHLRPMRDVYFCKQTIGNACGTMALLHAIANNRDKIPLLDGSVLAEFLVATEKLPPLAKGRAMEANEEFGAKHETHAKTGETPTPQPRDVVEHHFVAFVCKNGRLIQLDGARPAPTDHGPSSAETILEDAVAVCKQFAAHAVDVHTFSAVAIVKAPEEEAQGGNEAEPAPPMPSLAPSVASDDFEVLDNKWDEDFEMV